MYLPGRFKSAEDAAIDVSFFSSVTEAEIPTLTAPPPPKQSGVPTPTTPLPAPGATNQIMPPAAQKKRHWRFLLLLIALFCVLTLGTFAYASTRTTTTGKSAISTGKSVVETGKKAMPLQVQVKQQQPGNTLTPGTRSLQVSKSPSLTIQAYGGNVTIHPGNEGTIFITTNTNGSSQGADIAISQVRDQHQHDVIIVTSEPLSKHINYDITVPTSTKVSVIIAAGSISVAGVSGVMIETTSGSLTVKDISGPVKVQTVNGDIAAHNIMGQMSMETTNGSIRADTLSGQLKAISQNGDIIIQQGRLSRQSTLQTKYGSVRFTGTLDPQGIYILKTQSGDIVLALPANAAIQLHAVTGSGSISNAFANTGIGNAPQAQIIASTGSGSVKVIQA